MPDAAVMGVTVAGSLALAAASHVSIENWLRFAESLRVGVRPSLVVGAALTLIPVILVTAALRGRERLTSDAVQVSAAAPAQEGSDWDEYIPDGPVTPEGAATDGSRLGRPECHVEQPDTQPADFSTCLFGDVEAEPLVVLTGDNHAGHWLPAFETIGEQRRFRLLPMTKSACLPIDVAILNTNFNREYTECEAWRQNVLSELRDRGERVDTVIIAKSWGTAASSSTRAAARSKVRTRSSTPGLQEASEPYRPGRRSRTKSSYSGTRHGPRTTYPPACRRT